MSKATPMTTKLLTTEFIAKPLDNLRLSNLCGPLDQNLRQIAIALDVTIARRSDRFSITGTPQKARSTVEALGRFYDQAKRPLGLEDIQLDLIEAGLIHVPSKAAQLLDLTEEEVEEQLTGPVLHTRRNDLHGRTPRQKEYLRNILGHDITFGVGPAGTGKTYLAVACAVDALERDMVQRIVLTRPAVEAGERLGFLPGDLAQKVDPYLRPLYDALYDLLGYDKTTKLFERSTIEIAPLAYMRGRTLNHSFIILDEAQNTTPEQMKMFLTRIGFGSKAVVTGDVTQIDLSRNQRSGLVEAQYILKDVRGIAVTQFTAQDVVRHPLVARIVEAYEQNTQPRN